MTYTLKNFDEIPNQEIDKSKTCSLMRGFIGAKFDDTVSRRKTQRFTMYKVKGCHHNRMDDKNNQKMVKKSMPIKKSSIFFGQLSPIVTNCADVKDKGKQEPTWHPK